MTLNRENYDTYTFHCYFIKKFIPFIWQLPLFYVCWLSCHCQCASASSSLFSMFSLCLLLFSSFSCDTNEGDRSIQNSVIIIHSFWKLTAFFFSSRILFYQFCISFANLVNKNLASILILLCWCSISFQKYSKYKRKCIKKGTHRRRPRSPANRLPKKHQKQCLPIINQVYIFCGFVWTHSFVHADRWDDERSVNGI